MTHTETLRLALEALETSMYPQQKQLQAITAIKATLEAKDEPWTPDDTAYRPNGLPQDFIKHEVESPEDWSEWVCPNPDEYFMKCCDCGLVHEVQYRVARYGEGDYCELVDDKDVQAQFRMRRRTPPQQEAKDEPVVWMYQDKSTHEVRFQKHMKGFVDHGATYETPLYTTPSQRKPLTDEEIAEFFGVKAVDESFVDFVRAIEAAHGIKGEA